jgi:hypothetical protein
LSLPPYSTVVLSLFHDVLNGWRRFPRFCEKEEEENSESRYILCEYQYEFAARSSSSRLSAYQ